MKPRMILGLAIIVSMLAGSAGTWFLKDMIVSGVMVSSEAKQYASRVSILVVPNSHTFSMNPDGNKVTFWQSGGNALAFTGETWIECAWQLDVCGEDKPTSGGQGDFMDVLLKVVKWKDGSVSFNVLCGGDYQKKVYFDNVVKLDSPSGGRMASWTVTAPV